MQHNAIPTVDRTPSPNYLLDPAGAGAYIGGESSPIKPATLADWRCKRTGPPFVKVGRLVRYRLEDLDVWLNGRVVMAGR